MELSNGDKVRNRYNLRATHGLSSRDIKANTDGRLENLSFLFNKASIVFRVDGMEFIARDVSLDDIVKA